MQTRLTGWASLALAITSLLAFAPYAQGQGADAFASPSNSENSGNADKNGSDLDSQEGLESATPTDNVNELGSESNNETSGNAVPPTNDFPASNDADGFNVDSGDDSGSLFNDNTSANSGAGNGASGDGAQSSVNNAFGPANGGAGNTQSGAAAASANAFGAAAANGGQATPANSGGSAAPAAGNAQQSSQIDTMQPNVTPVSNSGGAAPSAVNGSAPVNNSQNLQTNPADAQALMNEMSGAGAPSSNAAPLGNGSAPINGTQPPPPASADVPVQPPVDPGPVVTAPPLPPPNEFAGAPPVPGTQRIMAEGEAPEEYKVEQGDTLYDICDQLLDEPGYWPKLWALNPEIKNPHFIFPNMRLRFYPGDDETPPYLQVVTEDDVIPIDKGNLDEQQLVAEKVIFPVEQAAEEQTTEVVGPDQVADAIDGQILSGGRLYEGGSIHLQVPGFIYAQEKEPLGFVLGGRDGGISLSPNQQALVEGSGELTAGTLYTVLRPEGEVDSPGSGDTVGYKYEFIANLRIDRKVGESVYVGVVQDNRLSVLPNDVIVSYISTRRQVPEGGGSGSLASVQADIVGFEYRDQAIGGTGHYAFIDKGNSEGVSPGMYLPIYSTPGYVTSAFGSADLPVDYEKVGVMRIIDTTDAGAVGYVVRNTKEVRIGDRTGKG